MPQLHNGFGTWYYGKENVHLEWGACEHCHRITTLISYDTQRYLVGLHVPLIPFGRFRVLRECPACTKHMPIKLAQWESLKAEAREKALATVQNPPDSREELEADIGGVVAFHDLDTWNEIVPFLVERYPNDPDIVGLIGSGYHFFNHLEEAANALRVSLEAKEDASTRRELALVLIRLRRAEEAHEVLRPLLTAGQPENIQHWFLLAAAYQAAGNHRAALDLISEANRQYPETATDKDWKELKKTSEKHLDSGKVVVPKILKTDTQRVKETSAPIARFAGPVVGLALVIVFAVSSYNASQHHKLYFVNGLDRPYEVQWDGQTYKLGRNGLLPIETAEGEHALAAPDIGLTAMTISIDANPFTRPFTEPLYIVNPDQVAPIIWESLEYADKSDASGDGNYKCELYLGLYHRLKKVNFAFQPFPDTIMGTEGSKTTRTRVGVARDWTRLAVYNFLTGQGDTEAGKAYLLRAFEHNPGDITAVVGMQLVLTGDEYLDALREKLDARPVLIEVHRAYQEAMAQSQPDYDIVAEYTRYQAAEPEDGALKYLLARVLPSDEEETRRLYREACEAEPPCAHAFHGLAYLYLREGRPDEALEMGSKACELAPENADFRGNYRVALIAAQSWDALLKDIDRDKSGAPTGYAEMEYEVVALASLGTPAQDIDQKINRTLAVWRRDWLTPEQSKLLQDVFKALAAYVRGDLENFSKHGAAAGYWYGFATTITEGDLDKALAAIDTMEDPTPMAFALAYLLAEKAGNTARSDELLVKTTEKLKEGSPFQKHAAACLAGERECALQEMDITGSEVGDAAILLTALGVRFPEHRQELYARARLLNFDPRFPHRFLAEILGDPPAEDTPTGSDSTREAPESGPESTAAETQ